MSLTRQFAADLIELGARPLEAQARAAARALVVDGIAVAALGAREPAPRLLADLAFEAGAKPVATVIGRSGRTSAAEAARVNGASMHVLDFEPMWNPANHALSTTLPALLALAETEPDKPDQDRPLGMRLLGALAVGIEAQARLRLASGQFEPGQLLFHPPGTVGPIGSAVGCGVFLGLGADQLGHAIGIAASRAGTVLANVGSMTKSLHCGQAAAAGLEAAALAARGFTADADALAGPRGYGRAFFGHELKAGDLRLGEGPLHIVEPGPAFKLYPSQYGTHFVITAALEAGSRLPADARIVAVRIRCPVMPYVDRPAPATGLAGKFSFQYVAAIALLDRAVTVASFQDGRRFAPDIEALLPKIALDPDPACEGRFDRMRVEVEVETDRGTILGRCDGPPGIWGRPAQRESLDAKARSCLEAGLGSVRADTVLDLASRIDELDGTGVRRLMTFLAEEVARG